MFRKYFGIQIDNPCSENWENMTPSERGRFCNSCSKQVVDFSVMSDADIVAYFKKHKNVCGRFAEEQLDRNLLLYNRKQTLFGKAIAAVMLLFQTFIAEAQTDNVKPKAIIQQPFNYNNHQLPSCSKQIPGDSGVFTFQIVLFDSYTSEPIQNARVYINGDTIECLTSTAGKLTVEMPIAFKDSSVQLTITKEGYIDYQHEILLDTRVYRISMVTHKVMTLTAGAATTISTKYEKTKTKDQSKDLYRKYPGLFRDF